MKKEMVERFKRERGKIFDAVKPTDWVRGDNAIEITVKIPKSLRDVLEDWAEEEISELIRVLAFMGCVTELKGFLKGYSPLESAFLLNQALKAVESKNVH